MMNEMCSLNLWVNESYIINPEYMNKMMSAVKDFQEKFAKSSSKRKRIDMIKIQKTLRPFPKAEFQPNFSSLYFEK